MAKLSAHGKELLRVERERQIGGSERSVTWERVTRTYHADGKVLQKYDVRFKPDTYHPQGELHSYGWKLFGRLKRDRTAQQAVDNIARSIQDKGAASTWRIVSGGAAPVIISQERIIKAIQSGENVGFCRECGHAHYGVEPDARNYTCEKCGASAVYGAEEMLF
jgi:hypothetical protein